MSSADDFFLLKRSLHYFMHPIRRKVWPEVPRLVLIMLLSIFARGWLNNHDKLVYKMYCTNRYRCI